jgi:Fe-S-cluster containining protein
MTFTIAPESPGMAVKYNVYYKKRGCIVESVGDDFDLAIMIPKDCPNLTTFGCKIYDARPGLCREYDGRLDPLMKKRCKLSKL